MATISSLPPVRRNSRSKQLLFVAVALATLLVLYSKTKLLEGEPGSPSHK